MIKDTEVNRLIDVDVDNGYGQYIIIDDSLDDNKDNSKKSNKKYINIDCYDEYNEYLTHCDHCIDPPLKNNMDRNTETPQNKMDRNTETPQNKTITMFNNPLICAVYHIVGWIS